MRSRAPVAISVGLVLLTLAVFGQTVNHDFLNFDDDVYLTNNPQVQAGLTRAGVLWSFGYRASNWHPMAWLSHMLDVQLFGLRPGPHHLMSAAIHAAGSLLLFIALSAATGALWRSAFVAALFAVHPLHVESVAWAAERKDVLSGLFWFLTLTAYLSYVRKPGLLRYTAVLLLFAFGLAAKPMLVSLPLILLALDFWPLARLGRPFGRNRDAPRTGVPLRIVLLEKLPLLALAAANGYLTWRAQTHGILPSIEPGLPLRLANAAVSYATYLQKTLWPAGLAPFYPYPVDGIPWYRIVAAAAVLGALALGAVRLRRRRPWLLLGGLWYCTALLPVIGIVQVGAQSHADRYTYVPLVGVFIAAIWQLAAAVPPRRWAVVTARALALSLLGCLALAAAAQTARWKDSYTIMKHAAAVTERNYLALCNLGLALLEDRRQPREAVETLLEAVLMNPRYPNSHYNLGFAWYTLGRYPEALASFAQALELTPHDLDTRLNIGVTLMRLGRSDEAVKHFTYILGVDPQHPKARLQLARAQSQRGTR